MPGKSSPIAKDTLGLAAEYAVASELCRRNVYAQLTFGNQKRTDILAFSDAGQMIRVEVKSKQGRDWPTCRGVSGEGAFLVFVDFQATGGGRPEFYILSSSDWVKVVDRRRQDLENRGPPTRLELGPDNVPVFPDQPGRSG